MDILSNKVIKLYYNHYVVAKYIMCDSISLVLYKNELMMSDVSYNSLKM